MYFCDGLALYHIYIPMLRSTSSTLFDTPCCWFEIMFENHLALINNATIVTLWSEVSAMHTIYLVTDHLQRSRWQVAWSGKTEIIDNLSEQGMWIPGTTRTSGSCWLCSTHCYFLVFSFSSPMAVDDHDSVVSTARRLDSPQFGSFSTWSCFPDYIWDGPSSSELYVPGHK